uniref:Proteasomal ubiquitin receptor ADRM1 homolog n=1 Tax=Timema poppense TaxID=170557 RepID=A0A7R9GU01_TIMPO|nr:unnamed protein product [Timema poppensis]
MNNQKSVNVGVPLFQSLDTPHIRRNLLEFKAGQMTLKGRMVYPDTRKGLVFIYCSSRVLKHFCWRERENNEAEIDIVVFPGDCIFQRVPQCTTGRVYLLKFYNPPKKLFFWLQEPNINGDQEICASVNEILNQTEARHTHMIDVSELPGWLFDPAQLIRMFETVETLDDLSNILSAIGESSTDLEPHSDVSVLTDLSNISNDTVIKHTNSDTQHERNTCFLRLPLMDSDEEIPKREPDNNSEVSMFPNWNDSSFNNKNEISSACLDSSSAQVDIQEFRFRPNDLQNHPLSAMLTLDNLMCLLDDPKVVHQVHQHLPGLDDGTSISENLHATLASTHFQHAVRTFSAAFQSRQLGPILERLNVDQEVANAAALGNTEAFVKILQRNCLKNPSNTDEKEDEKISPKDD